MTADPAAAAFARRDFLKLGAGAAAGFAVLGLGVQLSGCSRQALPSAAGHAWLSAADLPFVDRLVAAVAGPALPAAPAAAQAAVEDGRHRIDVCLAALGGPAQKEVRKLLDLVQWAPFRRFAGGVGKPWDEASTQDMEKLLAHFRDSRLALLNGAYRVLVKLGATAFWSQPASFAAARYPGPPAWAVAALNA